MIHPAVLLSPRALLLSHCWFKQGRLTKHKLPIVPSPSATMPRPQNPVVVTPSSTLSTSGSQTSGMIRQSALVNLTPNICATRMIAKPHSASAVHHHGEQDTIVFAFSGHGTVVSEGGNERQELAPGDFALIPAWAEHQEVNEGDEEVRIWVETRCGMEVANGSG